MKDVELRPVVDGDLHVFFAQQLDPMANHLAAFTAAEPSDADAFMARWERMLADPFIVKCTIVTPEGIAGYVSSYEHEGRRELTYWLGRDFWNKGIATAAVAAFLTIETRRPIHARAATDNTPSLRVLAKCGFAVTGTNQDFANARGRAIEETLLILAPT